MDVTTQLIYRGKASKVTFRSEAPLETIEAVTTSVTTALRPATGEVQFSMPIRGFKFANAMMEEHFNENYMESQTYPRAVFMGKAGDSINWATPGTVPVTVAGVLELHGVKVNRTIPGTVVHDLDRNIVRISSEFEVPLADHNIKIPSMYLLHIATSIRVKVEVEMAKSERL